MVTKASDRSWKFIVVMGWKGHYLSPEVREQAEAYLKADGAEVISERDDSVAFIDQPGMCLTDRELWHGCIDGLQLDVPATDVEAFIAQLEEGLDEPRFAERGWWNIYGWQQCLSVTREQYAAILRALKADREEMAGIAKREEEALASSLQQTNAQLQADGAGVSFERVSLQQVQEGQREPLNGVWN